MKYVETAFENKTGGAVHSDAGDPHKYEGVYGECPPDPQHDLMAVEPNDTRPDSPHKAKHLFGNFSD